MDTTLSVSPTPEDEDRRQRDALAMAVLRLNPAQARQADELLHELLAEPLRRYAAYGSAPASADNCAIAWELLWRLTPWLLPRVANPFAVDVKLAGDRSSLPTDRQRLLEYVIAVRNLFVGQEGGGLQVSAVLDRASLGDNEAVACVLLWGDVQLSCQLLGKEAQRLHRVPKGEANISTSAPV